MSDADWTDSQGRKVPAALVSEKDRMVDGAVRELVARALSVQGEMEALKSWAMQEARAAQALIFDRYGAAVGGAKGGLTLTSFDGSQQVKISVSDRISFGPELQAAKSLIDTCIETWAAGGNDNIRALVEHAFQVNKAGRIDTGRVLGLRALKMQGPDGQPDPMWARAMEAISDAIRVDGSATYIRFYRRNERTSRMEQISLDLASL